MIKIGGMILIVALAGGILLGYQIRGPAPALVVERENDDRVNILSTQGAFFVVVEQNNWAGGSGITYFLMPTETRKQKWLEDPNGSGDFDIRGGHVDPIRGEVVEIMLDGNWTLCRRIDKRAKAAFLQDGREVRFTATGWRLHVEQSETEVP